MKKRTVFSLIVFCLFMITSYGQEPVEKQGVAPANYGSRDITANGLTQIFSVSGNYYISADGTGSINSTYAVDVNKINASSVVFKAYLMAASQGFSGFTIPNGSLLLAGTPINWISVVPGSFGTFNHYADVTAIVAPIINAAAPGIHGLTVTEPGSVDGTALLVVFSDPAAIEKTIVIMFGALSTTGDNFSLTLGTAIDPDVPGALLNMGIGISFGAYGPCEGQRSEIDINGQRLTSSAGGEDDGTLNNGALITVGGIGDLNTNPPDPFGTASCDPRYDDELYSLLPLITNATVNILVNTLNPSNDDNVFLSYFEISGVAIIGEGIILTQTLNQETVGSNHTVKAQVQDDNGDPVAGKQVDFTVLTGPNAGANGSAFTNAQGEAFFTYPGTGGVGPDVIQACFENSLLQTQCSNELTVLWIDGGPLVPLSNWALAIGILLIIAFTVIRFRR